MLYGGSKMLVLGRRKNESIVVGDDVRIIVLDVRGDYVKIGVSAPKYVSVHRHEIYKALQREGVLVK
jgi:carbon storage regulator